MIYEIHTGQWKQICYVIEGEKKKAIIIDPGSDFKKIKNHLSQMQLEPIAILNTHAHFDHVGAVAQVEEEYGIPFYLSSGDARLLRRANLYQMIFEGKADIKMPKKINFIDRKIACLDIGNFSFKIHHTPGHTMGSICIEYFENLFTGDTLLEMNLIPKNLPEGDIDLLKTSYKYLKGLNDALVVRPGHGSSLSLNASLIKTSFMDISA
jgi:hydroxyacylglutathione hydrolase